MNYFFSSKHWGYFQIFVISLIVILAVFIIAGLISSMFRDTDLVPTDILAGFVLLRVKQKRESREQRRIELMAEQRLKYTSGNSLLT